MLKVKINLVSYEIKSILYIIVKDISFLHHHLLVFFYVLIIGTKVA